MNDLISVIVPVYNVEKYISKCLDSIISQTYSNLEIIVVNDGSSDGSLDICKEYEKKDKRIKVYSKENGGLSSARNYGIEKSCGKYLSFIDSDDYIDKDMILKLYNAIISNNVDISVCNFYREFSDHRELQLENMNSGIISGSDKYYTLVNDYAKIIMSACNKLYKRSIFDNIKYPVGLLMEDSYVILDILKIVNNIYYVNEPLYYYVQRDGSIMHSFSLKSLDILKVYEKRMEFACEINDDKLLCEIKKTYIYNIILKIIPGLLSINNVKELKMICKKVKALSRDILKGKGLSFKERIKFRLFSLVPVWYSRFYILKRRGGHAH